MTGVIKGLVGALVLAPVRLVLFVLLALGAWVTERFAALRPRVSAAEFVPWEHSRHVETYGSVASYVYLDRMHGTATKVYAPTAPVKALYWLAFQAPFPYSHNLCALKAAEQRRRIAGLLTQHFFGQDMVAPVLEVRCNGGGCAFITELVPGEAPSDREKAQQFLGAVSRRFVEVGLPTWQINPTNPKATQNLIETADGQYKIIDLESALVSPVLPPRQWWDALKTGNVPIFDDVFFPKLRRFVSRNGGRLRRSLGAAGLRELRRAIRTCEAFTRCWQRRELRIWAHLTKGLIAAANAVSSARKRLQVVVASPFLAVSHYLRRRYAAADHLALDFARRGIDRWRSEGRLSKKQIAQLEHALDTPGTVSVLAHLGAHLALSIPLRFPLGSIARFLWTGFFRFITEICRLRGRHCSRQVRVAGRRIHTLPVMIASLIPGLGAGAYLLAEPIRKNRLLAAILLDQSLRRLPFRLYCRLHLGALTAWMAAPIVGRKKRHQRRPRSAPAAVRSAVASAWAALVPYRKLVAIILVINVMALIAAGLAGAALDTTAAFDEMGPITALKSVELLLAGVAGQIAFFRFWHRPRAEASPRSPGIFFWLLSGWGLTWFAFDDFFQIHERLGQWAMSHIGSMTLFLNNIDDVIILSYAVAALAGVYLFRREILSSQASLALVALGVALSLVMLVSDFFAPEGSLLAGLENPAQVMAVAFLFAAYAVRLREVQAESRYLASREPVEASDCLPLITSSVLP